MPGQIHRDKNNAAIKPGPRFPLIALLAAISVLLFGCSRTATLETPQGQLKVESLEYVNKTGTFYANDPHRMVLTLARADGKMFSVDDLNYIIQSGAYLTDNQGRKYTISREFKGAVITESQTDNFRLEFSGKPGKDKVFSLHWPDNDPVEIEREKHYLLDG